MAAVGFAILFSGVVNGYFAAAGTSALLTFVLPVTIPAPASAIPARLEGWALAALAGICAHALLWPARPRATLRREAARACDALAELAEHELAGDRTAVGGRAHAAGKLSPACDGASSRRRTGRRDRRGRGRARLARRRVRLAPVLPRTF